VNLNQPSYSVVGFLLRKRGRSMGCMDEKEVRKAVQFEYFIEMFGSCDKESLTKLFSALLVKLNDNGVMFSFPDIQTKDCYVPIYDSNGIFRERLKVWQKLQGKV